jgi:hypothetical protein
VFHTLDLVEGDLGTCDVTPYAENPEPRRAETDEVFQQRQIYKWPQARVPYLINPEEFSKFTFYVLCFVKEIGK